MQLTDVGSAVRILPLSLCNAVDVHAQDFCVHTVDPNRYSMCDAKRSTLHGAEVTAESRAERIYIVQKLQKEQHTVQRNAQYMYHVPPAPMALLYINNQCPFYNADSENIPDAATKDSMSNSKQRLTTLCTDPSTVLPEFIHETLQQ